MVATSRKRESRKSRKSRAPQERHRSRRNSWEPWTRGHAKAAPFEFEREPHLPQKNGGFSGA